MVVNVLRLFLYHVKIQLGFIDIIIYLKLFAAQEIGCGPYPHPYICHSIFSVGRYYVTENYFLCSLPSVGWQSIESLSIFGMSFLVPLNDRVLHPLVILASQSASLTRCFANHTLLFKSQSHSSCLFEHKWLFILGFLLLLALRKSFIIINYCCYFW